MSVSAIFPSSTLSQTSDLQNANQQRRTEFAQLTQALQSGNLTNAQQAFAALTSGGVSSSIQGAQLTQDLNNLGSALQSGDLAGARNAYSAVQQSFLSARPLMAHHHHAAHRGEASTLTSGLPDGTSGSSGSSAGSALSSAAFKVLNLIA